MTSSTYYIKALNEYGTPVILKVTERHGSIDNILETNTAAMLKELVATQTESE